MDAISKESCSTECFLRHKIGLNCTVGGTSRLREPMNGTVSVFRQLELELAWWNAFTCRVRPASLLDR